MFACVPEQSEEVVGAMSAWDSVVVWSLIKLWIIVVVSNVSSGDTGSETG